MMDLLVFPASHHSAEVPAPLAGPLPLLQAPRWSTDGKTIFFCGRRDRNWKIYRVEVPGGNPRQLTADGDYDDVFPDVR